MKLTTKLLSVICLFLTSRGYAQETQNWFFLTHNQKVTQHFGILADVQLRASDEMKYLSTLLLRSAVNLEFNDRHSAAIGYAWKSDWIGDDIRLLKTGSMSNICFLLKANELKSSCALD